MGGGATEGGVEVKIIRELLTVLLVVLFFGDGVLRQ